MSACATARASDCPRFGKGNCRTPLTQTVTRYNHTAAPARYRYRVAEADCWYEELIDSDSGAYYQSAPAGGSVGYGGGTNVRGHIFAGNYALTDYALVGFTYYSTRLINENPVGSDSRMGRLQVNTIIKF